VHSQKFAWQEFSAVAASSLKIKGGGHSDRLLETSSHLTKRDSA
jgi:hypothetical protein